MIKFPTRIKVNTGINESKNRKKSEGGKYEKNWRYFKKSGKWAIFTKSDNCKYW